jgi:hypothetical protein
VSVKLHFTRIASQFDLSPQARRGARSPAFHAFPVTLSTRGLMKADDGRGLGTGAVSG